MRPVPSTLTADRLRDVLHYDPLTGRFTWIRPLAAWMKPGTPAGVLTHDGYVQIRIDKRAYHAHRLAWLYVYGVWPKDLLDHISGIRSENWISNLREATPSENARNRCAHPGSKSGLKGVYPLSNGKFEASIWYDGCAHRLGHFDTPEEASAAYQEQARLHHGDFAPKRPLRPVPTSAT